MGQWTGGSKYCLCAHVILIVAWWGGASEAADMIHGISPTPPTGSDLMWVSSMVMLRTCILATTVYGHNQVLGNGHWYFTSNQATWQHSWAPEEWRELLLLMIKVWDIWQQSWVSLKCTETWMFRETMSAPHFNVSKIFFFWQKTFYTDLKRQWLHLFLSGVNQSKCQTELNA